MEKENGNPIFAYPENVTDEKDLEALKKLGLRPATPEEVKSARAYLLKSLGKSKYNRLLYLLNGKWVRVADNQRTNAKGVRFLFIRGQYNVGCMNGHVWVAPHGSELERKCIERANKGFLDALCSPDDCEKCLDEQKRRESFRANFTSIWKKYN